MVDAILPQAGSEVLQVLVTLIDSRSYLVYVAHGAIDSIRSMEDKDMPAAWAHVFVQRYAEKILAAVRAYENNPPEVEWQGKKFRSAWWRTPSPCVTR